MLPEVNKADMTQMMEAIEEYFRSCHDVVRAPLAYVIRKTIIFQTYGDYPKCMTPDNKMIVRMLHLSQDKSKLLLKHSISLIKENSVEYDVDNRTIYDILDQICKDTDVSICQAAQVQKEWKRGVLCYPLYVPRLKPCKLNSMRS